MKTPAERLQWLRIQKFGERGKAAMAKAIGVNPMTYDYWEKGGEFPQEKLPILIDMTNVNPRWFYYGKGEQYLPARETKPGLTTAAELIEDLWQENDRLKHELFAQGKGHPPALVVVPAGIKPDEWLREHGHVEAELERCVLVPILAGRVAAGAPRNVMEHQKSGWAVTYRSAIRNPRTTSAIRVDGDSMEPHIPDGSLVWIDYSVRDPAVIVRSKHKIAAIRVDDGVVIRRVSKADGHWLFLPENETAQNRPAVWAAGEGENPVVGKMVALWAKFD